jgi:WD40 repeat protein
MLWSLVPPVEAPPIEGSPYVRPAFSPDGEIIVTYVDRPDGARIAWWATRPRRLLRETAGEVLAGFLPGGELCTLDETAGTLLFRKGEGPPREVKLEQGTGRATSGFISWAPSRALLLCAGKRGGEATVWDCRTGRALAVWRARSAPLRGAALAPDGRWAALGPENELARNSYGILLTEIATGAQRELLGHHDLVQGVTFSHDGSVVATGSLDATIRLWNVETGEPFATFEGHLQDAIDVAFSPDGRTLASIGAGRDVKLWHIATGREVGSLRVPGALDYLVFSPDGRALSVNTRSRQVLLIEAR